ncbi:MAG: hypothetical protein LPJ87_09055 [Zoogloeaceae bacterium]|nr:hypothetical protein [Zoogloeaceae bacterium]
MNELPRFLDRLADLMAANFGLVTGVFVAWVVLMAITVRRGGARWRPTRPLAVFAAIVSSVSALFMVPGITGKSFGAVANWGDWLELLAIALASGLLTFAFAWPAVATALRARQPHD